MGMSVLERPGRVDPSVSVLDEIADQDVATAVGGTSPLTSLLCLGASYVLGNQGMVCTWTVECQSNCS